VRRRTRKRLPAISAEEARQALQVLVEEGRVAAREVASALRRRDKRIRELREKLAALGAEASAAFQRAARRARPGRVARQRAKAVRRRAKRTITRAQRVARQAQGRYMAAIRRLSKDSKEKVRAIRKSSGVRAAIAAAKKLAG